MSDLISRQKVLNTLDNMDKALDEDRTVENYKELLTECIKALPSADVRENIHGEWIKIQSGDKDFPESIVCSKCKNANSHLDFNEHDEPIGKVFVTSKFCPNCGAKMKGGE